MKQLTTLLLITFAVGLGTLGWLWHQRTQRSSSPVLVALAEQSIGLAVSSAATLLGADRGTHGVDSFLIGVGPDRLRLQITGGMDGDAARAHVREERQRLDLLFFDRQAPYPGQLSNTLRCPEKYQPTDFEERGTAIMMLGLYANDRLAYGGCSPDLLRFKATQGFFHDSQRSRLIEVEYFSVLEHDDAGPAMLRSFQLETK